VMSGLSLDKTEQEMALAQLGIEQERTKKKAVNGTVAEEEESDRIFVSAAERLEKTKEKSPFVAEVIGVVGPKSVAEDGEDMETLVLTQVSGDVRPESVSEVKAEELIEFSKQPVLSLEPPAEVAKVAFLEDDDK
jgi:hypothetical protein